MEENAINKIPQISEAVFKLDNYPDLGKFKPNVVTLREEVRGY